MVQLSHAIGIIIAFAGLCVDFGSAVDIHIKSQIAFGDGCPSGWVSTEFQKDLPAENYTYIAIEYPDLTPEVTAEQYTNFAAKSCHVTLELDELPAGQQVAMTLARFNNVDAWTHGASWSFYLDSEIQFQDGLLAVVRWFSFASRSSNAKVLQASDKTNVGDNIMGRSFLGGPRRYFPNGRRVTPGTLNSTVDLNVWSPCMQNGGTIRMSINERWAVKNNVIRWTVDPQDVPGSRTAWIGPEDLSQPAWVEYQMQWRPC
jgi:hypothetical protein